MKKTGFFFAFLLSTFFLSAQQIKADAILGTWLNATGKGEIQIYKTGNAFFGKIVWLKEPNGPGGNPKLDTNNPDPVLRTKPIIGTEVLRNFSFDSDEWTGGRIYDPQNGKDYKCIIKLKDPQTLSLRGYIGVSLFGRTEVWTRVKK